MNDDVDSHGHFEGLYRAGGEPWSYSDRAVEVLRHERVTEMVRALGPGTVLELGCSLGLMTERLAALPAALPGALVAVDVAPTAVRRARERVRDCLDRGRATRVVEFAVATVRTLPFADRQFDVVIASDGLQSWRLGPRGNADALRAIHDVLAPGGRAIFTEHMHPRDFPTFVALVESGPLQVETVSYLGDRFSYQFEGWLKAVRRSRPARALRANLPLARALSAIGRRIGASASRHICIVARRDPATGG